MFKKIALLSVMAIASVNANVENVEFAEQTVIATMTEMGCSEEQINEALKNPEVQEVVAQMASLQDLKSNKKAQYALVGVAAVAVIGLAVYKFDLIEKAKVKMFGTLDEQIKKATDAKNKADKEVADAGDKATDAQKAAAKKAADKLTNLEAKAQAAADKKAAADKAAADKAAADKAAADKANEAK